MTDTIHNREAIEMMERSIEEIRSLRNVIASLRPRAEAYDAICTILDLLPKRSIGMGEDLIWRLQKRIEELQPKPAAKEEY